MPVGAASYGFPPPRLASNRVPPAMTTSPWSFRTRGFYGFEPFAAEVPVCASGEGDLAVSPTAT